MSIPEPVRLPLLTTSAAGLYRACPRAYYLAHELMVRPLHEGEARSFGSRGHKALEAWWIARKLSQGTPFQAAIDTLADIRDDYERAKLTCLVAGYDARWSDSPLRPLAVEAEYTAPLRNPATGAASRTWMQAGKMDVIVQDDDSGEQWVMDHKFTAADFGPGSDYRTALLLDSQVSNYLVGAVALGYAPRGWIHDVIARPRLRPLKATPIESREYTKPKVDKKTGAILEPSRLYANQREADETPEEYLERLSTTIATNPDEHYARFPVVRLDEEAREAAFDLWQVGRQIADSRSAHAWPRNPSSCQRYGTPSRYVPVCTGQASPEDGTRYRRAERAHEELGVVGVKKKEGEAA